jgi:hypothetical protein
MKMIRLTAVAGLAAVAIAGCGGGSSSNKTLSYSDFGTQASAICKSANNDVKPLSQKLNGEPANDEPILGQLISKQQAAVDKFKGLKPPSELKPYVDKFTSISDQQIVIAKKAQTAAKSGDKASYQSALKELQPLSKQSDAAASKMGAKDCVGG